MSSLDEEEKEFRALVCEKSTAGVWNVNKSKLRAVVEAEGFTFVDLTAERVINLCAFSDKTVLLLTHTQMCLAKPNVNRHQGENQPPVGWLHRRTPRHKYKESCTQAIDSYTTKCEILKWTNDDLDCVVCYESTNCARSLERVPFRCKCGTVVCFGCTIDLMTTTTTGMEMGSSMCPNCRRKEVFRDNWENIFGRMHGWLQCEESVGAISAEHLDFVKKMTSVDLSLSRERALEQVMSILARARKLQEEKADDSDLPPEIRKKKVAGASAEDSSSAVDVRSKGGCANCRKQFWYKSEWKRAPKCAKCRRTAYCSAKCRKMHAKAHAGECVAMRPKKKKAKRK